jgi:hypothetical protein
MTFWQTILVFGGVVIIFDGVWSVLARIRGYNYAKLAWVSLLIYLTAGSVTASGGPVRAGILVGMITAGVDATIGWWLSWKIGPGRLPYTDSKEGLIRIIIVTVGRVMLTGAFCGLVGALIWKLASALLRVI